MSDFPNPYSAEINDKYINKIGAENRADILAARTAYERMQEARSKFNPDTGLNMENFNVG